MKLDFTELLYALSFALDSVEIELTGVKTEHGKRVAYLSYLIGKNYGLCGNELVEFVEMKTQAYATFEVLNKIPGLEDIAILASRHHEKLDGSGYPFGLKGDDLSFEEKLLAVIDIYQALTESRPYREGFSHEKSISIMEEMVEKNQLDGKFVEDIGKIFGNK